MPGQPGDLLDQNTGFGHDRDERVPQSRGADTPSMPACSHRVRKSRRTCEAYSGGRHPPSGNGPDLSVRSLLGDLALGCLAHAARLRRAGETRVPLYVMDAGYDEAPVTWELREHLDRVQILVRVRNDRVMYRDPAPEPGRPGRPRRHGADRFECADPGTWGEPDQVMIREDDRYGMVTVMSWGGLHPKLACRGHFEAMARPPVITCHLSRPQTQHDLLRLFAQVRGSPAQSDGDRHQKAGHQEAGR